MQGGNEMQKPFALIFGSMALFAATPPPQDAGATPVAASAGLNAVVLAKIHPRMQEFVDHGAAAGFVTLVARHGRVASLEAIGWQDLDTRKPMRTSSLFQIMSMTKPITCAAVMTLVDDGRLSINDPVEKYLPEFKGQKLKSGSAPAHPVSLRDLMTHTSGIPARSPKGFERHAHTLAEVVADAAQESLEFEPGSQWSYSNNGIATLGRILEVLYGKPFEQVVDEKIFKPRRQKPLPYGRGSEAFGAATVRERTGDLVKLHFFISRAGEDREWAKWIANVLEAAGHTTTLQEFDFKPGHSIPHEMTLALERADHVIAVLSPQYLAKDFTLTELYAAFFGDPLGKKRLLIPVRVAQCDVSRLINQFIYVDFVGKPESECRQALLDAIRPERIAEQVAFPGAALSAPAPRTSIQKLPTADPNVFGRDAQLDWLEQAWANPQTNFVQIIAPGGAGKAALMTRWYRRHLADATIFGWSFYSQGTREKSQTSSDPFFAEALPWFGIAVPATATIDRKSTRLNSRHL